VAWVACRRTLVACSVSASTPGTVQVAGAVVVSLEEVRPLQDAALRVRLWDERDCSKCVVVCGGRVLETAACFVIAKPSSSLNCCAVVKVRLPGFWRQDKIAAKVSHRFELPDRAESAQIDDDGGVTVFHPDGSMSKFSNVGKLVMRTKKPSIGFPSFIKGDLDLKLVNSTDVQSICAVRAMFSVHLRDFRVKLFLGEEKQLLGESLEGIVQQFLSDIWRPGRHQITFASIDISGKLFLKSFNARLKCWNSLEISFQSNQGILLQVGATSKLNADGANTECESKSQVLNSLRKRAQEAQCTLDFRRKQLRQKRQIIDVLRGLFEEKYSLKSPKDGSKRFEAWKSSLLQFFPDSSDFEENVTPKRIGYGQYPPFRLKMLNASFFENALRVYVALLKGEENNFQCRLVGKGFAVRSECFFNSAKKIVIEGSFKKSLLQCQMKNLQFEVVGRALGHGTPETEIRVGSVCLPMASVPGYCVPIGTCLAVSRTESAWKASSKRMRQNRMPFLFHILVKKAESRQAIQRVFGKNPNVHVVEAGQARVKLMAADSSVAGACINLINHEFPSSTVIRVFEREQALELAAEALFDEIEIRAKLYTDFGLGNLPGQMLQGLVSAQSKTDALMLSFIR